MANEVTALRLLDVADIPAVVVRKVCTACGERKPTTSFSPHPHGQHGVRSRCKPCVSKASIEWRDANRDKVLNAHLRRTFGITLDDYNAMLARQGGVCAICGNAPVWTGIRRQGASGRLAVDHDHATGRVRGLLCIPCNQGIGHLRDSPEILRAALRYLEEP